MSAVLRLAPPELTAFERMAFDPTPLGAERREQLRPEPQLRGPDRIVVVVNPDAGAVRRRGRSRVERLVRYSLGSRLADLRWSRGDLLAEALARAAAQGPDLLAVIGGDGTARAALDAGRGRLPVAPLPGGTLNLISRAVWGRRRGLRDCLAALPAGRSGTIPAGRIGDRRFYAVSGFGPLMELGSAREDLRGGAGPLSVWPRFAEVGRRGFAPAVAWSDGSASLTASALVVGLGPVDSAFGLAPRAPRSELEAAGAALGDWGDVARLGARVAARRWRGRSGVAIRRGAAFTVAGLSGPVAGLLDGERCLLPERFTVDFEPAGALAWGAPA